MVGATAAFSLSDALAKLMTDTYPVVLIVWGKYLFQMLVISVALVRMRPVDLVKTRRPFLQIGRSALSLISITVFIVALAHIPLADTIAVGYVSPLLVTALSVPLLGERVGVRRWSAVIVGFFGALIIIRPGLGVMHWAVMLPLVSATLYALYQIMTRMVVAVDHPMTTLFYSSAVGLIGASFMVPFFWVMPTPEMWANLFVQGSLGALAHFMLIRALAYAPVSTLAPFSYTGLLSAAVLGYLFFGDFPDRWTIIGAGVIVGSGLYVIYRETTLARQRR